jgi:hypothetical protein
MKHPHRRQFLHLAAGAAVLPVTSRIARAQSVSGLRAPPGTAPTPDFSGVWGRFSFPAFVQPPSGPGPLINKSRRPQSFDDNGRPYAGANAPLVSNNTQLVGDFTNPILRPQAAETVKKHGEIELGGHPAPNPANECWPSGVPFVFWNLGMQMLQQPDKITILYVFDHEVRQVRLDQSHPVQVTPSWFGDSVGHYEGNALVIDTVGVKVGPLAMVDHFGTPRSAALHVVERYKLIDDAAAREVLARDAKELFRFPRANDSGVVVDPNFRGRHLLLELTIEDENVFTTPWSANVIYRPAPDVWPESVCAENPNEIMRKAALPIADKPDF